MNVQLNAKCLQYCTNTRPNQGGTLIMLLAIIFISGILAAIALPSLLSQIQVSQIQADGEVCPKTKAPCTGPRNIVVSLMRAEQAYYIDKGVFADSEKLELIIPREIANYRYRITYPDPPAKSFKGPFQILNGKAFPKWYEGGIVREFRGSKPAPLSAVAVTATAKVPKLKSYIGLVWAVTDTSTNQSITHSILCQSNQPSFIPPELGISKDSSGQLKFECGNLGTQLGG